MLQSVPPGTRNTSWERLLRDDAVEPEPTTKLHPSPWDWAHRGVRCVPILDHVRKRFEALCGAPVSYACIDDVEYIENATPRVSIIVYLQGAGDIHTMTILLTQLEGWRPMTPSTSWERLLQEVHP